jgi:NADPH:quinone reductase-like Zn-dependent oxidoreductase
VVLMSAPETIPQTMAAVLLTGHGGYNMLEYRQDVPVPKPQSSEVLIRVGAAGVNNTDINTRIGWYSKSVSGGTSQGGASGAADGSWSGVPLIFPIIQGADICGCIVAVGDGADAGRIGERVIVPTMQPKPDGGPFDTFTVGSECNGGFAQYVSMRASQTCRIESSLSDVELASFPCAYSTAENMLHRADVKSGERVLITGASGGVGSAAVQLAKRRGATVIAQTGTSKSKALLDLGAARTVDRNANLSQEIGGETVDVVIDIVGGQTWPQLLDILVRGGRYVVSGAIAGPMVELDLRTLYLKDLTFLGCTAQHPDVFGNLVGYIERNEIRPLIAAVFPLSEIVAAQQEFQTKKHVGKIVLVPSQE